MKSSKTLKSSIALAEDLRIKIVGDIKYRGDCPKEDTDLASFFAWVRYQYKEYYDLIFHNETEFNPQGGSSYAYHAKSKSKGRLDGLADIVCLPISKGAPAFICELKRKDILKSLSGEKRKTHFETQLMRLSSQQDCGNITIIALGLDAVKQAFTEYVEEYK